MDEDDFMDEVFVPIDGYPNYVVSNYGRIININTDRELKHTIDRRDDKSKVTLYYNGNGREFGVHRLVAKAFFINYDDTRPVEFLNGDPQDCTVLNLTIGIETRPGVQNDSQTYVQDR